MDRKKKPGRNIREGERSTIAVKLRLPPEYVDELDDLAARHRLTRSGTVALLLDRADGRTPRDVAGRSSQTEWVSPRS